MSMLSGRRHVAEWIKRRLAESEPRSLRVWPENSLNHTMLGYGRIAGFHMRWLENVSGQTLILVLRHAPIRLF